MSGWLLFAAAFAAFFVTHSIPTRPAVKARLVDTIGPRGFTTAYSILSLVMLGVLIAAAGNAPYVQLWPQMLWQRYVILVGMFATCVIAALAIGRPNPFSFGGPRGATFDPARPGIVRLTRHPLLLALALWAGLHLLPNGDLAHVILFGVFAGFALLGRKILDRRNQRLLGADRWQALLAETRKAPLLHPPASWTGTLTRLAIAAAVFILLLALHPVVIGVSPLP